MDTLSKNIASYKARRERIKIALYLIAFALAFLLLGIGETAI